jgi:hypothetical protein
MIIDAFFDYFLSEFIMLLPCFDKRETLRKKQADNPSVIKPVLNKMRPQ